MPRFTLIKGGGDDDSSKSDGRDFQCDCTAMGGACPCTRWGPWVPSDRVIPREVRCDQCTQGNHSG